MTTNVRASRAPNDSKIWRDHISSGDPKGEYKKEFVKDILERAEDEPIGEIRDGEHFRQLLAEVKE